MRMIRSLEKTVQLSAQRLLSLKTKDTNSVMHALYDILEILTENIYTFCNCYLRGRKPANMQSSLCNSSKIFKNNTI